MVFKRLLLLLFCMTAVSSLRAQDNLLYEEDIPLLYRNEATFGGGIHTSGFGLVLRKGKHITGRTKRMLELDVATMKHPKEEKTKLYDNAKAFVYGKLNNLLLIRTGIGFQKVLYTKGDRSGVEVRFNGSGGLSFGITKPVYLYINQKGIGGAPQNDDLNTIIERYDPDKHQISDIYGRAEFIYGLDRLSIYPGFYGKSGFSFEYGKRDIGIKSIETGAILDLFLKDIPLMAFTRNNPYYFSLYIDLLFGKKW